jgi:hypothetical protein
MIRDRAADWGSMPMEERMSCQGLGSSERMV